MENTETGKFVDFVANTVGGEIAVCDLCEEYARRIKKGEAGVPIIRLSTLDMKAKKNETGKVKRPHFEIVDWDTSGADDVEVPTMVKPVDKTVAKHDDMDDSIPF